VLDRPIVPAIPIAWHQQGHVGDPDQRVDPNPDRQQSGGVLTGLAGGLGQDLECLDGLQPSSSM